MDNISVESATLKIWQKEPDDIFDYYFEFEPSENFDSVDMIVCEQYYIKKLTEMYFRDQNEYSTTFKQCIPVSNNTRKKIIEFYENRNIKMMWE